MKRIHELDGLRGLAIILILIWHYFVISVRAPSGSIWAYLAQAAQLTWSGVDLFFVLSGFLIGGILLDNFSAQNYYKAFYIRRAFRILPLYWVMVAGLLLLIILAPSKFEALYSTPLPLWSYLTFTQNYLMGLYVSFGSNWLSVTWSLAIEEQFYLILPFLIRRTAGGRLPFLLFLLILLGPFYRFTFPGFSAYVFSIARIDSLMLGVLLAYSVRKPAFLNFVERKANYLCILFVSLVIGAGALTLWDNRIGGGFNHFWLAMLYAVLLLQVVIGRPVWLARFFRQPALMWFGKRSYGIYLFHLPLIYIWYALLSFTPPAITNVSEIGITCLALASTILLSEVSFWHFENRFIQIGHAYSYVQTEEG